ncbi:helix-turn-helix domain-containing protein [Mycolicibacterium aubagnense]|uniref:helix-turn-helix domain-containing protein n=1 Tax=Mycolicibacterium aubagnense TaxID=319707 RepID=UPI0013D4F998|nr:helix-turn-helix transcriptional regulator [Mycolicibacterium aubagnense]
MKIPSSGPARLDHYVSIRIGALRMSRIELARRGGPDRSTLHKATTGDRTLSTRTLTRLDQALGWAEGTSAAILDGGEPVCASSDAAHVQTVLKVCEDLVEQSVESSPTCANCWPRCGRRRRSTSMPAEVFDDQRRAWIAAHTGVFMFQTRRAELLGKRIRARVRGEVGARPDPHDDKITPPLIYRLDGSGVGAVEIVLVLVCAAIAPIGWALEKSSTTNSPGSFPNAYAPTPSPP